MNIETIYTSKLNDDAIAKASINLPSGQLVFGTYSIKDGKLLNKKVTPGSYDVSAFWIEEEHMDSLNASVGLNMVVIDFNDNAIVTWEEVTDVEGNELADLDCFEFLVYDQSNIDSLENSEKEVKSIKEICYSDGMAELKGGNAVNIYIGEDSVSNKVYWALDAENNPVKLVFYFDYGYGSDEE